MLLLINPFGGAGAAPRNWAVAQTLFQVASSHIDVEVRHTDRANHAY